MRILIAPDSFKESLSAKEVALALKSGFSKALPDAEFDLVPIGDGGEGTLDALVENLNLEKRRIRLPHAYTSDGSVTYASDGQTAIFEMAEICGLEQIPKGKRNPLSLTTQGVGELIVHLVQSGIRDIIIGVGGSATNDGGIGMAYGLGYRFYDSEGQSVEPLGANLSLIKRVSSQGKIDLSATTIRLITDVDNPLCGLNGATYIFGGQKGLDPLQFERVDQSMKQFYKAFAPEVLQLAGSGAGGGMAAGLVAFADAEIKSGINFVLDCVNFNQRVKSADLVIVGEGRMDRQSLSGKAPVGVAKRTPSGIPVIAICGSLKDDLPDFPVAGISAAFPIIGQVAALDQVLASAKENLYRTGLNIGNLIKLSQTLCHKKKADLVSAFIFQKV